MDLPFVRRHSCIFRELKLCELSTLITRKDSAFTVLPPVWLCPPQNGMWGSKAALRQILAQGCAQDCTGPCRADQAAREHDEAYSPTRAFDGVAGKDVYEPEKVLAERFRAQRGQRVTHSTS